MSTDLSTSPVTASTTSSAVRSVPPHTSSAAAGSKLAAKTDTRPHTVRSSGEHSAKLQSKVAARVRCRARGASADIRSSRSRSPAASSSIGTARVLAAASSIASGNPSSRRQISCTSSWLRAFMRNPGAAAAARRANSATAG